MYCGAFVLHVSLYLKTYYFEMVDAEVIETSTSRVRAGYSAT
jgi:hypothetical protein